MPKAGGLQGFPLEEHSQEGKRKAEMLQGAFQTLGRLQPLSSELVHARDPARKITPRVPAQVPALENHYFSIPYKEHPYIHLFSH